MTQNEDSRIIEARLERSLRRQIQAPKLDGRFDAAVWARIAAETRSAEVEVTRARVKSGLPRWLVACNVIGVVVTVVLVAWSLMGSVGTAGWSIDVSGLGAATAEFFKSASFIVTLTATIFGLAFTRGGRRMLMAFR